MSPEKLTRREVIDLWSGIQLLDTRQEAQREGGKIVGVASVPLEFDARVRYALAKTLKSITDEATAIQAAQKETNSQRTKKKDESDEAHMDRARSLEEKWQDFLKEKVEVNLHKIEVTSLNLDNNKLTPSVLASLIPMLQGDIP